jgi:redox-sensitive bicupin YhaK (pirin superfamily)
MRNAVWVDIRTRETVTVAYQGELEHRDSSSGGGKIGAGDVQWMTAATASLRNSTSDFTRKWHFARCSFSGWTRRQSRTNSSAAQLWTVLAIRRESASELIAVLMDLSH